MKELTRLHDTKREEILEKCSMGTVIKERKEFMKKRIMLQKANKILAAVMTASMLTSTIVPGTAVYASEISAPEVETEDGFSDGVEEETPVVTQNQEETPEFDDGSVEEAQVGRTSGGDAIKVSSDNELWRAIQNEGAYIELTCDLELTQSLSIRKGMSLTIDLAGHSIIGSGDDETGTISVGSNAKVTIKNSDINKKSSITDCKGNYGAISNDGELILDNIKIENNVAKYGGGGIYNGGTLKLSNVTIQGNTASGEYGGGGILNEGSLELSDVTIQNNIASTEYGGGIYNTTSAGMIVLKNKIVISNNKDCLNAESNLYWDNIEKTSVAINELKKDSVIGLNVKTIKDNNGDVIAENFSGKYLRYFIADSGSQKVGLKKDDPTKLCIASKDSDLITEISNHEWKYKVIGDKITFYCIADDDCEYEDPQTLLQLNMNTNDLVYSGETKNVIGTYEQGVSEIIGVAIEEDPIKYEGINGTTYPLSEEAPINAGTYKATKRVYIGDMDPLTVTKEFEITKADPVIEFNEDLTYSESDTQHSLISKAPSNLKIKYTVDNGTEIVGWPTATEAGKYTISYEFAGDDNHKAVTLTKKTIIVKPASSALLTVEERSYSGTYDGNNHSATVTAVEGATVKYSETKDGEYKDDAPVFRNAGEYSVYYKVSKKNYETVTGKLSVKISKRELTVKGITAEDKPYDGNDNAILSFNSVEFNGIADSDRGKLGVTATGKFAHVYADSTHETVVNLSGLSLTGDLAENYELLTERSQKTASAWISRKTITASITPNGGIYGGTITPATAEFIGLIEGEEVSPTLYYSGTADNGTVVEETTEVPTDAGTYTVRVANDYGNNYDLTGEITAEFKIAPRSLTKTSVVVNAKDKNEFEVLVTDGNELKENKDYTVELSKEDEVFTVTVTGIGNYTGSIEKKITSVEKPADGKENIATAVTPEDDTVVAMKPSMEIPEENAKNLLISCLPGETNITNIINGTAEGSYDATIYLEMNAVTSNDVPEDVAKIEKLIKEGKDLPSNANIGLNLDLKLMMNCVVRDGSNNVIYSGNRLVEDTTGKSEQKITFTIPENLKTTASNTTRTYYIVCVHKGKTYVVPSTVIGDRISFTATQYSTYAIVYKDTYYAPSYPVTGIKVSTDKVNLTKKGETAQVKVEVTPSYADNKNLTWKSSDEKVATVDKDGKITAVGNGTATITVTSVSGNYTATITVTVKDESEVKPGEIEKITVDAEAKTLTKIGESVELKVKVEPENADSSKLTWKSSNEKVAVVDKTGKVTAVGNGTVTITVTTEDGKHTATVTITVKAADEPAVNKTTSYGNLKARSVKQTNTSVTLEWTRVSGADGYLIYGNRCNGNGKTYKYQKLATITNGKTRTWTQTGLKKGTYYKYIVKAYKLVNGKKVVTDTSVSVHAVTKGGKYGVAKAVSVTKIGSKKNTLKVTLKSGKTAQITAKEVKMDKAIRHHRNICYESSNTKVATVTPDGLIQATGKGTCSILVYAQNGVYKTITVTVK